MSICLKLTLNQVNLRRKPWENVCVLSKYDIVNKCLFSAPVHCRVRWIENYLQECPCISLHIKQISDVCISSTIEDNFNGKHDNTLALILEYTMTVGHICRDFCGEHRYSRGAPSRWIRGGHIGHISGKNVCCLCWCLTWQALLTFPVPYVSDL